MSAPSRTPAGFASLDDLLKAVTESVALSDRQKSDRRSAINSLARMIGRPPADISAQPRVLRRQMDAIAPARFDMSPGRWANIKSLVLNALKITNVRCIPSKHNGQLSPAWRELREALPERPHGVALTRFMHWATAREIEPGDVDQTSFDGFSRDLEDYGLRSRPREAWLSACRAWNWAAGHVAGWPQLVVTVDDRRNRYSLEWEVFPAALKQDIDRMVENAVSPDPLSLTSRRPIKETSAKSRLVLLRRIASALVLRGHDPQTLTSIADLVEPEAARDALRFFLDRNDGNTSADIHQMAKLLCTLARHHVGVPESQQTELDLIRKRLDPGRHGMTEKNRSTLRHFEDPTFVDRFVALPEVIARRYRPRSPVRVTDAVSVQIALAIELLTIAPVRIGNLANIHLERNLIRTGHGPNRTVHLFFPASSVKNGIDLEFELPHSTVDLLDLYLDRFRPILLRAANDYLFPGEASGPKGSACLGDQIADAVRRGIGVRLTPHQFRHLAGFLFLKANPGGYEVVRQLLGHKSIDTTIQFYAGMEIPEAIRHYDNHIATLRSDAGRRTQDGKTSDTRGGK